MKLYLAKIVINLRLRQQIFIRMKILCDFLDERCGNKGELCL